MKPFKGNNAYKEFMNKIDKREQRPDWHLYSMNPSLYCDTPEGS